MTTIRSVLTGIVVTATLSGPTATEALTLTDANSELSSGADIIVLGCVTFDSFTWDAIVCVNDTPYQVADGCTLDESVYIYSAGGADLFIGVQDTSATYYPCGSEGDNYYKVVSHSSYVVEFYGGSGNDWAESSTGATRLYGEDGADELYQSSSYWTSGGNHSDQLVCDFSGAANDDLLGYSGDDCLWDQDPLAATFDCGEGGETWGDGWVDNFNPDPPPSICEVETSQCGFSFQ